MTQDGEIAQAPGLPWRTVYHQLCCWSFVVAMASRTVLPVQYVRQRRVLFLQLNSDEISACMYLCVCWWVGGRRALRRSFLSGGLTGRAAALILALIDAPRSLCMWECVCVSLAGSRGESRDPCIPCPGTHAGPSTWTRRAQTLHTSTHCLVCARPSPTHFLHRLTQHAYRWSTHSSPSALQQLYA